MDKYLGKRLDGRYEMRELIGVGGMAYVYKAYDIVDDCIVAVKILKDEFLSSEEFVRRFRNESKAIAILNHPNIVKVSDVGFGERLQYIVMEYIDGITLKEYLDQRKDIRWKEAVHFTVQILRALQHAHDKGIVHRDIKPQNIMLLSDGTIKVTDFGIARLTRSDLKATVEGNKAIGSVHYISPEQARGEITDEKTDLYSVGIMLYEMLTGCLPFVADNAVSVAIMQMQSEAKAPHLINGEIPEGLEQITLKAMQKNTCKRYQSAAEMLSDFDEFKRNPSIKFEYTYIVDETPTRYVDAITRVRGESNEAPNSNKEEPVAPKKNNKKTVSMVLILLLVTLLTIGGMVFLVIRLFNTINKPADMVAVEKFIGMSYIEEIKNNASYNGIYKFEVIEEDANDPNRDVGEVFKQRPAAGDKVKKGSTITLYVNNDTPDDVTLDVKTQIAGEHKDDIRKLLVDKGLRVIEVAQSHDEIPENHVISIDLELGKSYAYGTQVKMFVSSGQSAAEAIDFPPIIGYNKADAVDFLATSGFKGNITNDVVINYSGTTFMAAGKVVAVAVNGVKQDVLPEKISSDANITLYISSGMKDVSFELEWPDTSLMIDVRVTVDGRYNTDLVQNFAGGIKPQSTTKKLAFDLTSHPTSNPYLFEVEIKKHDAGSNEYQMYIKLKINPVTGDISEVLPYQFLPGITVEPVAPEKVVITENYERVPKDMVKQQLEAWGLVVVEKTEISDTIPADSIIRIELNGKQINPGDTVNKGATITLVVSSGSAPIRPEEPNIPGDVTPVEP